MGEGAGLGHSEAEAASWVPDVHAGTPQLLRVPFRAAGWLSTAVSLFVKAGHSGRASALRFRQVPDRSHTISHVKLQEVTRNSCFQSMK